jgi:transcriptional/translational regulatory protein YebC/TACO1
MNRVCSQCLRARSRIAGTPSGAAFISTSPLLRSGHNKWSKIKHDKARNDADKSKQRTNLLNDITKAIECKWTSLRVGADYTVFGADPTFNPRLAAAITKAKRASCPKDAIEGALARGQGLSPTGSKLDAFTEEAMLPSHSLAILIECLTDNKNRTRLELRNVLKDHEANLASTAYLFSKRGHLKYNSGVEEEKLMEAAIDAGALDVATVEDGSFEVLTEVVDISKVCGKIKDDVGVDADDIDVIWVANSNSELPLKDPEDQPEDVLDLVGELRSLSSVRGVYTTVL